MHPLNLSDHLPIDVTLDSGSVYHSTYTVQAHPSPHA